MDQDMWGKWVAFSVIMYLLGFWLGRTLPRPER